MLREYLEAREESISAFARRSGLDRVWLQRLLKFGRPARVGVIEANAIHKATKGKVPMRSFAEAA